MICRTRIIGILVYTNNSNSLKDLLRYIRNMHNHYNDLPEECQDVFSSHDKLFEYFKTRFPNLVWISYSSMEGYKELKHMRKFYPKQYVFVKDAQSTGPPVGSLIL